jgi:hypothetical protein
MKKMILLCSTLILFIGLNNVFSEGNTIKSKPVRVWNGSVSSNWYTIANWSPLGIPNAVDSVIIPGNTPYSPVVEGAYSKVLCKGLNLESDSSKSSRSGMIISGGEIIIDGSLTITTKASMTIESDGALTVNGNTKIMATGGLDIESGGSLITNGTITGTAYVKRIINGDLKWHFLSCPVTSHEILNGSFAPTAANFITTSATTYDFYKFNTLCGPLRWINLRKTDGTPNYTDFGTPPQFDVQIGYLVAYGSGFPTTKVFTGTPNTGDKTYTLASNDSCNWNLLGNPYPSAITWDNVSGKEGNLSSGYYYVWNDSKDGGAGYEAYLDQSHATSNNVDGNIPSMQGFFVRANPSGNKSLGMLNSSRVHDGDYWLKKKNSVSPSNKLTLTFGNGTNFDETFILFGSGSVGKDWYDAEKIMSLESSIPQVYTLVDNDMKTLYNSMPYTVNPVTVPVGIVAPAEGDYTIKVSGIESFNSLALTLEDLNLNTTQNMVLNPVYSFKASGNEDAGRFLLHFASPIGINDQQASNPVKIYASQKTVFISGITDLHNASATIYNLVGQEILTQQLSNRTVNKIVVNAPAGYYIVKVLTQGTVTTSKVNIN